MIQSALILIAGFATGALAITPVLGTLTWLERRDRRRHPTQEGEG